MPCSTTVWTAHAAQAVDDEATHASPALASPPLDAEATDAPPALAAPSSTERTAPTARLVLQLADDAQKDGDAVFAPLPKTFRELADVIERRLLRGMSTVERVVLVSGARTAVRVGDDDDVGLLRDGDQLLVTPKRRPGGATKMRVKGPAPRKPKPPATPVLRTLEVDLVEVLTLPEINIINQSFSATFFIVLRFPGGALDADLASPSAEFPVDEDGRPTFRPSALWYIDQIDFNNSTEWKRLNTRVRIFSSIHTHESSPQRVFILMSKARSEFSYSLTNTSGGDG